MLLPQGLEFAVLEVVDMRWEDYGGLRDMEDKTESEGTMNLYMENEQGTK